MRIGLLIYGDINSISGGYLYNRQLLSYLRNHGEQVQIFSLPLPGFWQQWTANFSGLLYKQIAAAKLDVLIEDAMVHPSVLLLNRRLAAQLNLPVVALLHLLSSEDRHPLGTAPFYRVIERRFLRSVSGIIANSQTTLMQTTALLGKHLPAHCVAVPAADHFASAPISTATVVQRALQTGPLHILAVGNVIRRKGLHVLIKALSVLPAHDFKLTVVGRLDMQPHYVRYIQNLIQQLQLTEVIQFSGALPTAEVAALYRQHQLLVLPSAYESYGIVYVEAMQFGLPAIGTTTGAAWEIIRNGENGYLINPEDWRELAQLLQNLQADRQLLLRLSTNALAAFALQPTWAESGERIRRFLYSQKKANACCAVN
jgi:glycosyltransferase involved in cell wall biosynthesis